MLVFMDFKEHTSFSFTDNFVVLVTFNGKKRGKKGKVRKEEDMMNFKDRP